MFTPADIERSISAYESLLESAKSYRNQLVELAASANEFGTALEKCARTKGVGECADGLQSSAGLHYLVANHQSVLSDTIYRTFEIPLREELECFVKNAESRKEEYVSAVAKKTKLLREREQRNLMLARKKKRKQFKEALSDLTQMAEDIDKLKAMYYNTSFDAYTDTWSRVHLRTNLITKAELNLYTSVASKSESLNSLIAETPDPFVDQDCAANELFSIVPPFDILARPQSPDRGMPKDYERDARDVAFASLIGQMQDADTGSDCSRSTAASFFSTSRAAIGGMSFSIAQTIDHTRDPSRVSLDGGHTPNGHVQAASIGHHKETSQSSKPDSSSLGSTRGRMSIKSITSDTKVTEFRVPQLLSVN